MGGKRGKPDYASSLGLILAPAGAVTPHASASPNVRQNPNNSESDRLAPGVSVVGFGPCRIGKCLP
jgi:hypothetical protein